MADIRTIKIFLASSEELADERIRFGDFIRTLDDTYEQRGFRIKLIKWEDLPKGNDGRPTQETYNEHVRQCDLFVSLFYTKAGEFTLDEYNVANMVENVGYQTQDQLKELYSRCDLFFFPSLLETFSVSLVEAMYFKMPIVATDIDFNREVTEDAALSHSGEPITLS